MPISLLRNILRFLKNNIVRLTSDLSYNDDQCLADAMLELELSPIVPFFEFGKEVDGEVMLEEIKAVLCIAN